MRAEADPARGRPADHRPRLHRGGDRRDQPAGAAEPASQPAQRRVGPPHHRQLRDAWSPTRCAGRCGPASRVVVPRVSDLARRRRLHPGQDRGRGAGGGPGGRGRRPAGRGSGALGVPASASTLRGPGDVVGAFGEGVVVHTGDDLAGRRATWPCWPTCQRSSLRPARSPGPTPASRRRSWRPPLEFLLEGLHLTKRLNKDASGARALYRTAPLTGPPVTARYDYSAWDGTQESSDLDPEDLLAELTDDLLAGGDLNDALRRLLRSGMRTPRRRADRWACGSSSSGCARRREELSSRATPTASSPDLRGARRGRRAGARPPSTGLREEAKDSGDERRAAGHRRRRRRSAGWPSTCCPRTWRARSRACSTTTSSRARRASSSKSCMEELREQVAQTVLRGHVRGAVLGRTPSSWPAHARRRWTRSTRMLEQRERGRGPRPHLRAVHGAVRRPVPGQPADPRRAARAAGGADGGRPGDVATRSRPSSASSSQSLADSLLEDMDLRWQMERLSSNLQRRVPREPAGAVGYRFAGSDPMGMGDATDVASQLGELDRHGGAASVGRLADRPARGRHGRGAPAPGRRRRPVARAAGQADQDPPGGTGSSSSRAAAPSSRPRACAAWASGRSATCSPRCSRERIGDHQSAIVGLRPRPRGDDQALRVRRPAQPAPARPRCTTRCAATARACRCGSRPEDFEVVETEALTRSATVLLVDLSMSMPMRDNFVPAKKMAMALADAHLEHASRATTSASSASPRSPARSRPRTCRRPCGTTSTAPTCSTRWRSARRMLAHQYGTKQIIVVTDGEPTAHIDDRGRGLLQLPAGERDAAADDGRGGAHDEGRASRSTPSPSTSSAPTTPSSSRSPG